MAHASLRASRSGGEAPHLGEVGGRGPRLRERLRDATLRQGELKRAGAGPWLPVTEPRPPDRCFICFLFGGEGLWFGNFRFGLEAPRCIVAATCLFLDMNVIVLT